MNNLHIQHLNTAYQKRKVLHDISLAPLRGGELVALLGANAAGKSTLLKSIAGLVHAQGDLQLDGVALHNMPHRERLRQIGYLPQTLPQASALLVYEMIYSGLRAGCPELSATQAEKAVAEVLAVFGLQELALRRVDELSGGQRQMVGLAQVVARKPKVLLLDEPTSALDLRWQLQVIQAVKHLSLSTGMLCIIAVHDLNLALRFCERLLVLAQGKVLADSSPANFTPAQLEAAWGVHGRVETCSLGYRTVLVDNAIELAITNTTHPSSEKALT